MGIANLQGSCFMIAISATMGRLLWEMPICRGSCFMTVISATMGRLWACQSAGVPAL